MIIYWDKETNSKNRIGKRVKELRIQKKKGGNTNERIL